MIEYVAALIIAIVIIAKAGDLFVDSACAIARAIGVSQAVIALTLIAFATSAPEFFTSFIAAGLGNYGISYGNVVGSNIVNITPILALAAIYGIAKISRGGFTEGVIMIAIGGALASMSLKGVIGWIEGVLLLAMFALFLGYILKRETANRGVTKCDIAERRLSKLALLFVVGAGGVIVGSWLLVFGGAGIAQGALVAAGLTPLEAEAAIGFTVIAIGTSIPELVTILISIKKKLHDISIGTIVGSNIFNTAFIVGTAAVVSSLRGASLGVDSQAILFSNPMMLISMGLLLGFMWKRDRLGKRQGLALLAFYFVYLVGLATFYLGAT